MSSRRCFGILLAASAWGVALVPADAAAVNGVKERLPVKWESPQCIEYVDRTQSSVYSFSYEIEDEDPSPGEDLLPDEVADSRRHQFFALCRQETPQQPLPQWITWDDVERAVAKELVQMSAFEDDDVFETSSAWEGCWHRITPDDARLAISNENASEPVQWDTSGLAEGTYALWGYTWEPAFNLWSPRVGHVVKVFDGGDPADSGPGGAITTGELNLYANQTQPIEGCASALPGSTVTGYFATTEEAQSPDWQPTWIPFTEPTELEDETFSLEFVPDDQSIGQSLLIRVDITDPMGRTFEAHMFDLVIVLAGSDTGDCDEGGGFIQNPGCGSDTDDSSGGLETESGASTSTDTGDETQGNPSGSTTTGSTPSSDEDGGGSSEGCGCSQRSAPGGPMSALMLLGLVARGRKRRHP